MLGRFAVVHIAVGLSNIIPLQHNIKVNFALVEISYSIHEDS